MPAHTEFAEAKRKAGLRPYEAEGLKEGNHNRCILCERKGDGLSVFACDGGYCFKCHCQGAGGPAGDVIDFYGLVHQMDGKRAAREFMKLYGNGKPPAAGPAEEPAKKKRLPYSRKELAAYADLPESYLDEVCDVIDDVKWGIKCAAYPWSDGVRQIRWANGGKEWEGKGAGLYGVDYIDTKPPLLSTWEGSSVVYCFIVEGAVSKWNLEFAGQPVVASPSCSWRPEFAEHLTHCRFVLVVEDPPTVAENGKIIESGKTFIRKIANSLPGVEVYALRFWKPDAADPRGWTGYKDVNDLWKSLREYGGCDEPEETGQFFADGKPVGGSEPSELRMILFTNALQAAVDEAELISWGTPKDLKEFIPSLPPVAPFKIEYLPRFARDWVKDVTARMHCAMDAPAAAAVVCLAGVVNRRAKIYPKEFDKSWSEYLRLWGATVLPVSAMKTPILNAIAEPIVDLEREFEKEYEKLHKQWEREKESAELFNIKNPESAEPFKEPEPKQKRLFDTETTIQKLHAVLSQNEQGMMLLRDELVGWVKAMESKGHETDRTFWLKTADADYYKSGTLSRGSIGAYMTLSLFGNLQPQPLRDFLQTAIAQADGLLQRFGVLVYPDERPWKNIDQALHSDAKELFTATLRALAALDTDSVVLNFSPEAQPIFNAWMEENQAKVEKETFIPKAQHLQKYRGLLPRIAALFQLADCALALPPAAERSLLVDLEHLTMAVDFCRYLESHLDRVYSLGPTPWVEGLKSLSKRLANGDLGTEFSVRDLIKKDWTGLREKETVKEALKVLEQANWVRPVPIEHGAQGGRPSEKYTVNPKIAEM